MAAGAGGTAGPGVRRARSRSPAFQRLTAPPQTPTLPALRHFPQPAIGDGRKTSGRLVQQERLHSGRPRDGGACASEQSNSRRSAPLLPARLLKARLCPPAVEEAAKKRICTSQNHGVTEYAELQGTHRDHGIQPHVRAQRNKQVRQDFKKKSSPQSC